MTVYVAMVGTYSVLVLLLTNMLVADMARLTRFEVRMRSRSITDDDGNVEETVNITPDVRAEARQ